MHRESLSFAWIQNDNSVSAPIILQEVAPSLISLSVEPHELKFGSSFDFPALFKQIPIVLGVQGFEGVLDLFCWLLLGDVDHAQSVLRV